MLLNERTKTPVTWLCVKSRSELRTCLNYVVITCFFRTESMTQLQISILHVSVESEYVTSTSSPHPYGFLTALLTKCNCPFEFARVFLRFRYAGFAKPRNTQNKHFAGGRTRK